MKVSAVHSVQSTLIRPRMPLVATTLILVLIAFGMTTTNSHANERHTLEADGFAALERVDLEAMDKARAREGEGVVNFNTVKSVQNMKASVTDTDFNIGGDMMSGNINFASDALGSYSGTGIFSAVTGNGNSINNAVGISVFIAN